MILTSCKRILDSHDHMYNKLKEYQEKHNL
jgi:hypothetical protein